MLRTGRARDRSPSSPPRLPVSLPFPSRTPWHLRSLLFIIYYSEMLIGGEEERGPVRVGVGQSSFAEARAHPSHPRHRLTSSLPLWRQRHAHSCSSSRHSRIQSRLHLPSPHSRHQ